MNSLKAIILVGGQGTRLRPLTLYQPKPLLPILNRPFISYQLDVLAKAGVSDVGLAVGKQAQQWAKSIPKLAPKGMRCHFIIEKQPLGTGGAIRNAYRQMEKRKVLKDEPTIVFNGDVFLGVNALKFMKFFKSKKADGVIATTAVPDVSRFGEVKLTSSKRIQRFLEKQKKKKPGHINAGAYILSSRVIDQIPNGVISVEKQVFPKLLRQNYQLFAFPIQGYWNDIGTPETYLKAHLDLFSKNQHWTHRKYLRKRDVPRKSSSAALMGQQGRIHNTVVFEGYVTIGPKVRIGKGSRLKDCVLMEGCHVGENVQIEGAILGRFCQIQNNAVIGNKVVLGEKSKVSSYTKI